MPKQFECDLAPETMWPRVRFNFANGWSTSVAIRTEGAAGTEAMLASLACCPTGRWQEGITELGSTEAFADEAVAFLAEVAARPKVAA